PPSFVVAVYEVSARLLFLVNGQQRFIHGSVTDHFPERKTGGMPKLVYIANPSSGPIVMYIVRAIQLKKRDN
ncbi:MAG: hypothetical protein KDE58_34775, partial [Caldilineaceae bacterium]|nr:hypothetical protein [Caldilineaceae bacterium]